MQEEEERSDKGGSIGYPRLFSEPQFPAEIRNTSPAMIVIIIVFY